MRKRRILSLCLALVLVSTCGVFPTAAAEDGADWNVFLEPTGGAVSRAEIEDAIVEKILAEPVFQYVIWNKRKVDVGPLSITSDFHVTLWPKLILRTLDKAKTTSLTFPAELARFSACIGRENGDAVACGGGKTRRVPVKMVDDWETPVVLFVDGEPVVVIGGTRDSETVTVSYGSGTLTPVQLDADCSMGNQSMWVDYPADVLEVVRARSKTELLTATLTGRMATAEEQGAFTQAYTVTRSLTDDVGNELGSEFPEAVGNAWMDRYMWVTTPFTATMVRTPAKRVIAFDIPSSKGAAVYSCTSGTYVFGRWDCAFEDVLDWDINYSSIFSAIDGGWMTGTSPTAFSPYEDVTREMLVTTLWRMAGKPASDTNLSSYADAQSVPGYAVDAFQWALEKKIINPTNKRLDPKGMVTHEMLMVILTNYATMRGEGPTGEANGSPEYEDADEISPWAVEGVMFAISKGWIYEYGGRFNPQETYFRAELAGVLENFEYGTETGGNLA